MTGLLFVSGVESAFCPSKNGNGLSIRPPLSVGGEGLTLWMASFKVHDPIDSRTIREGVRHFKHMTSHLIEEALKKVPSQQALVNIVSKRVRQLNQGERPLVDAGFRAGYADIALQEVIEGKLTLAYPAASPAVED